jgi:hypothetical protein
MTSGATTRYSSFQFKEKENQAESIVLSFGRSLLWRMSDYDVLHEAVI